MNSNSDSGSFAIVAQRKVSPSPKLSKNQSEKEYMQLLAESYNFSIDEVYMIKNRYDKLSKNGILDKASFQKGLGLLGLEYAKFLCDRIFEVIDENQSGKVNFEQFLKYMHTLIDGTIKQKAEQSFRMLDLHRNNQLSYQDIKQVIQEMSFLWNYLTGSRIKLTNNYMEHIFRTFDQDQDGVVSFQDFYKVFSRSSDIFRWFEYLNQEDNPVEFWLAFQNPKLDYSKNQDLQDKIDLLQDELDDCLRILQDYEDSSAINIQESCVNLSTFREHTREQKRGPIVLGGPTCSSQQVVAKGGDDDDDIVDEEAEEKQEVNKIGRLFTFEHNNNRKISTDDLHPSNLRLIKDKLMSLLHFTRDLKSSPNLEQDLNRLDAVFMKLAENSYTAKSKSSVLSSPSRKNEKGNFVWPPGDPSDMFSPPGIKPKSSFDETFTPRKLFNTPTTHRVNNLTTPQKLTDYEASRSDTSIRSSSLRKLGQPRKGHFNLRQDMNKNISVFFGHENWNLVLNMMIGIRMALKSVIKIAEYREMNENDYKIRVTFDLIQEKLSKYEAKQACRFIDYAPLIFNDIRQIFGISPNDFLKSIGPENILGNLIMGNMSSLIEQSTSGKSGSFFYYSEDRRYMLKTISKKEFTFLKTILRSYHLYLKENPDSLIIRIFGMYRIQFPEAKKEFQETFFIVMGNIFNTTHEIKLKYDLKGSLHGRTSRKKNKTIDGTVVLKDLDFNEDEMKINLQPEDKKIFMYQLKKDSQFLASLNINDYSLLIGVHFVSQYKQFLVQKTSSLDEQRRPSLFNQQKFGLDGDTYGAYINSGEEPGYQLTFSERCQKGLLSSDGRKLFIVGIIDVLTAFGPSKKFEYGFKRTLIGKDVSCIPPQAYSERFINYISGKVE